MVKGTDGSAERKSKAAVPSVFFFLASALIATTLAGCFNPSVDPGPQTQAAGSEAPITDREPVDLNPVSPARVGDLLSAEYTSTDQRDLWTLETEGMVFSDGGSIRIVPISAGETVRVEVSYSDVVGESIPSVVFEGDRIHLSTPDLLIEDASFTCTVYANVNAVDIEGTVSLDWDCTGLGAVDIALDAEDGIELEFPINASVYNIGADTVNISAEGPATWMLMGNVKNTDIVADDGAVIFGANLNAEEASLTVTDGATVELSVSRTLVATTDTGGSISYFGSPEVTSSGQGISQRSGSMGKA